MRQAGIVPRLRLQAAARTDVGTTRRENQDAFGVFPDLRAYVVADGLGGHRSGSVASTLAVQAIRDALAAGADDDLTPLTDTQGRSSICGRRLVLAVEDANARLRRESDAPERRGMGTTVAAVMFDALYGVVAVCHVGDSRVFRIRDGGIEQLTEDHTVVQEWVRAGRLAPEEARASPHRHVVTRALGSQDTVRPTVRLERPADGDLYVLTSDGVHDVLASDEIAAVVRDSAGDLDVACASLVALANERGGRDNATAVAVRCGVDGGPGPP